MKLDLGCGKKPRDGFRGVDRLVDANHRVDLCDGRPWPFDDDSIDELWTSHFIEHIPMVEVPVWRKVEGFGWRSSGGRRDALCHFFSEAFRVAKNGAKFTVIWPCVTHRSAFRDPTHRRFIDIGLVGYLSREGRSTLGVEQYDIDCNWVGSAGDMVSQGVLDAVGDEQMVERCVREWNVASESVMYLVAQK